MLCIPDRSPKSVGRFLAQHAVRDLNEEEQITVLKLLELQRHAMLMYTSCGWFFDELSGIETVQIIQYAGRAVQLARELFGDIIEPPFLKLLERAKSNVREHRDGRYIYEKWVKPAAVDWVKVGAHYAVSSLFQDYAEQAKVYCYTVNREDYQSFAAGKAKFVVGRAKLTSEVTHESALVSFGVLHLGDHNLNGGVREFQGEDAYQTLVQESGEPFSRADFPDVIRLLDRHFGESTYSLRSLFRDEQRRILRLILDATLSDAEAVYRQLYQNQAPMMRFLADLNMPLPRRFYIAAETTLNIELRRAFEADDLDQGRIASLLEEARLAGITLDKAGLGYTLKQTIEHLGDRLNAEPTDFSLLQKLEATAGLLQALPFEVDLWKVQNRYYGMLQSIYPDLKVKAEQGDEAARDWISGFTSLGEKLSVRVA
jgi:hypothetical protein